MQEWIAQVLLSDHVRGISFALFGGFARIYVKHKGSLRLRDVFSGLLAAAFIGAVVVEFVKYYEMDRKIIGLSAILSGFMHTEMIEVVTQRFLKKLGTDAKAENAEKK